jgi:glycosyltransferase involved in cell wall biosynthesis
MIDFAIIIPCYNEETAIEDVLKNLIYVITHEFTDNSVKIFIYDNNSTDNSAKIVTDFIAQNSYENLSVELRHTYKQGKGYVIRQAFKEINARCYCMIDGDDTYSVSKLKTMYDLIINKKTDMVIGDRLSTSYFTENKRIFHNFGNKLVKNMINNMFNTSYNDILSGFRTFSYNFVKTFPVTSNGFTLETEMNIYAASHNMSVLDIPVDYKDRKNGSKSKVKTIPDGIRIIFKILDMFRLYNLPTN